MGWHDLSLVNPPERPKLAITHLSDTHDWYCLIKAVYFNPSSLVLAPVIEQGVEFLLQVGQHFRPGPQDLNDPRVGRAENLGQTCQRCGPVSFVQAHMRSTNEHYGICRFKQIFEMFLCRTPRDQESLNSESVHPSKNYVLGDSRLFHNQTSKAMGDKNQGPMVLIWSMASRVSARTDSRCEFSSVSAQDHSPALFHDRAKSPSPLCQGHEPHLRRSQTSRFGRWGGRSAKASQARRSSTSCASTSSRGFRSAHAQRQCC